ncbi:MAG: 1-(5-phosphoribosyl)-5-[(5-phosphoribosylamino)methylideneamino]imidazole-4-carboxamide isomerase [Chloroflexi bacterium]|nr:1-(5-phosphoribosyl)-5-[(5-phosphoribosylamino)methylideneamino]imidazole-4-carboxamide isomerase [Chloroflexota bacterium]
MDLKRPDFIVFPAIDLRGGQVVRLMEGDPNRQTSYSADPAGTALCWIKAGAKWLHVVNLDGAFAQSDNANYRALQAILDVASPAGVPVQFGGGLRSVKAIKAVLEMGVSRAVLGTLAIEQPQALLQALEQWGEERIGVSVDARDGRVHLHGWQSGTSVLACDLAQSLKEAGLRWLVFTDISRDGLQTGLNLKATTALARATQLQVIASGGVSSLQDVQAAKQAGLAGAIVGRALYENTVEPGPLFNL